MKAKKTSRSVSKSPARGDGETSDASYRSRSLSSGGRGTSADPRPSSRSQSKPKKPTKYTIDTTSDDDFVPSGATVQTRGVVRNTRSKSKSLKKSEMDSRNAAQNPGAMAESMLENCVEDSSTNPTDSQLIRQGNLQRAARKAAEKAAARAGQLAAQLTAQTIMARNSGQSADPEDLPIKIAPTYSQILTMGSGSNSVGNPPLDSSTISPQNSGDINSINPVMSGEINPSGEFHSNTNSGKLITNSGELIPIPTSIPGPSKEVVAVSQGAGNTPPGQESQVAKGSYLDRSAGRHSPYQRPAGAKGNGNNTTNIVKEIEEAEKES